MASAANPSKFWLAWRASLMVLVDSEWGKTFDLANPPLVPTIHFPVKPLCNLWLYWFGWDLQDQERNWSEERYFRQTSWCQSQSFSLYLFYLLEIYGEEPHFLQTGWCPCQSPAAAPCRQSWTQSRPRGLSEWWWSLHLAATFSLPCISICCNNKKCGKKDGNTSRSLGRTSSKFHIFVFKIIICLPMGSKNIWWGCRLFAVNQRF